MRIKISADSTCDLSPELIETYNIGITPLYIEKGGQNCRDGMDITPQEIFDYVRSGKGVCRTAAVNVDDYTAFFKNAGENYDAVIHFNISSDFSSCYQNACTAAAEFEKTCMWSIPAIFPRASRCSFWMPQSVRKKDEDPKEIAALMRETAKKSRGELRHRYAFLSAKGRQMLYLGGARREFIEAKAVH